MTFTVLNCGSIVTAKKDKFMDNFDDGKGKQYLTKDKKYTIIQIPLYYNFPIVILDDDNTVHHCKTSYFK